MATHGGEMLAARVAQVVEALRRAGGQLRVEQPVVEDPQRVDLQPPPRVIGQALRVRAEVRDQRVAVGGTAGRVADRVDAGGDTGQADVAVEPMRELDELGVDGRPRVADDLDVPLRELAVAAGLRAVVAEHRTDGREPEGPGADVHPVLDVGAHDAAVGSGRSAHSARSSSLPRAPPTRNISFSTASLLSPSPRAKSSTRSKSGVSMRSKA